MRFDISSLPDVIRGEVSAGNVYKANGGRGTTCFWIVVAVVGICRDIVDFCANVEWTPT